jgi:O-antigen ligase
MVTALTTTAWPPHDQAPAAGAREARADGATVLTGLVVLLFALPARLVFPPLGAAGRPAGLAGLVVLGWWLLSHVVPSLTQRGRQPVRTAILVYLYVYLIAYTLGYARGLPGVEATSSDRALLTTLGLAGVALVAADGIPDRVRLDVLLKRLTVGGAVMAVLGELQFAFGIDLVSKIKVPGLSLNAGLIGIANRGDGGLRRVAGTASHYIEFGVVAALLLPLAIHYALHARDRAERQWRWLIVAVIGAAVPFSISRSAFLCLLVSLLVLAALWRIRMQVQALVVAVVAMMAMRFLVPGLLGTIMSLFRNMGSDPSVQNREADYPIVFEYIAERPWFGRGPGTFTPERYILLDNELLGTIVSIGYVGLAALLGVFVTGFFLARSVSKHTAEPETRHLAHALGAGIVGAMVASLTFDSLGFPIFAGTLFLMVGAVGALWRTERQGAPMPPRNGREILKPNRLRRSAGRRRLEATP